MFGYVVANKQELRFREYDVYRAYYCGLCRALKKRGGGVAQLTLSYDMTFLVMLLSGLYEPEMQESACRCIVHPASKHPIRSCEFTEYAADMNLLLSYYNCMDDWQDERKKSRYVLAKVLEGQCKVIQRKYPEKTKKIREHLECLKEYESTGEKDPDLLSGCFGRLMGELFAVKEDMWEKKLRRMGFYLGKFIYLLDAYEDVEKDIKEGNTNPFSGSYEEEGFEEEASHMLNMMIAECAGEFEQLPIIDDAEILRNILYSGVWCRYETVKQKRKDKKGADERSV